MKKIIMLLTLLSTLLSARFIATPLQECEAFNNMKHTKNTHNITLKMNQQYTIIKKYKGQYLTLIKGESPAQRWVSSECLTKAKKPVMSKHTKKYEKPILLNKKSNTQSILVLSWHNAFCETHQNKRECIQSMREGKSHLVLHGLWPQPRNNVYCNVPKKIAAKDKHHQWRELPNLELEPKTISLLQTYMPGYISGLHKHEWIKHGTCYSKDEESYFSDALSLTREVDSSSVGKLLRQNIGKKITLSQIRKAFDSSFGNGAGKKVELKCKGGLLTELWINIGGEGDKLTELISSGKSVRSRCYTATVDRIGYR